MTKVKGHRILKRKVTSPEKAKGVVLKKADDPESKKRLMLCLVKRHLIPQWTEQHLRRLLARRLLMNLQSLIWQCMFLHGPPKTKLLSIQHRNLYALQS